MSCVRGVRIRPETRIYWISAFYCSQYLSSRLSDRQTSADLVRWENGESSLLRCRALSLVITDVSKIILPSSWEPSSWRRKLDLECKGTTILRNVGDYSFYNTTSYTRGPGRSNECSLTIPDFTISFLHTPIFYQQCAFWRTIPGWTQLPPCSEDTRLPEHTDVLFTLV